MPSPQHPPTRSILTLAAGATLLLVSSIGCERQRHPEPPRPLPDHQPAVSEPNRPVTPGARALDITTRQVSSAQLSAAPDGKFLVFSGLGQLFRVSTKGGNAEQLSFGPHYDAEPSVSPEGSRVVFTSDRDPEAISSLHLLNLSTGQVDQVVEDTWAAAPTWAPNGKRLAYLSCAPATRAAGQRHSSCRVREVDLANNKLSTVSKSGSVLALAYLGDGRLVWSQQAATDSGPPRSELFARDDEDKSSLQLHTEGVVLRIAAGPDPKSALVVKRSAAQAEGLVLEVVDLPGGTPRPLAQLAPQTSPGRPATTGDRIWLSERGALWHIDLKTGGKTALPLTLEAELEAFPGASPRQQPTPQQTRAFYPSVMPGGDLLFMALGQIWRQRTGQGASRVLSGEAFEWAPAPSPDGKRLAYQWSDDGSHELRLVGLSAEAGATKAGTEARSSVTISKRDSGQAFEPAWHPKTQQLVFTDYHGGQTQVVLVDLVLGKRLKLATTGGDAPGAHFSGDGQWLYFTAREQVQRVSVAELGTPEPITALQRPFEHARVSPDGNALFFLRAGRLFRAVLGSEPVSEGAVQPWADQVAEGFSFAPDANALVYADKTGKLWRRPLAGGAAKPLTIALPEPEKAPPLLVRNVRPLEPAGRRFLEPTSILIERGRIQWLGKPGSENVSPDTVVLEGLGHFAIPGLFDLHAQLSQPDLDPSRRVQRPSAFVAFGVTALADLGASDPLAYSWQGRGARLRAAVPRVFHVDRLIKTHVSLTEGIASGGNEARELVRQARANAASGILLPSDLPRATLAALTREASKQGLPLMTSGRQHRSLVRGALLGHRVVYGAPPDAYYDDVWQLLAATKTYFAPEISTIGNAQLLAQRPQLKNDLVRTLANPADLKLVAQPAPGQRTRLLQAVQQAHLTGVSLLPASSAPGPECFLGQCLHAELWQLVEAGLTPEQGLRAATRDAAQALGLEKDLGSLETGKLGDLVLLDQDPLKDVQNSLAITRVVLRGTVLAAEKPIELAPTTTADSAAEKNAAHEKAQDKP